MVRKTTWSLLILLLVSVQAFASACDIRCEAMARMGSPGPMVGMDHCPGIASEAVRGDSGVLKVNPPQPCTDHICKNDWSLLSRAVYEFGPLSPLVNAVSAVPRSLPIEASLRWKADRSSRNIPNFDPLLSCLRV